MVTRDMLSIALYRMKASIDDVINQFKRLTEPLGLSMTRNRNSKRVFGRTHTSSWTILWNTERLEQYIYRGKKHTDVYIYSNDGIVHQFESLFRQLLQPRQSFSAVESVLSRGDTEESGPLLFLAENPRRCFEGVKHNAHDVGGDWTIPQIRVINSSLGSLEELQKIVKEYSVSSKIIGDNLWIDFWWSKYSDSWKMQ